MTIGSDPKLAPATAVEWLLALSEHRTDACLRAEFEAWLAQDSRNAEDWAEVTRLDALIRRNGASNIVPFERRNRARRAVAVIALAAAAAVAVILGPSVILRMQADYMAPSSAVAAIPLADGSKTYLAPASAIQVSFTDGGREIRLLRGEAFFDVVPDPSRPFRVVAAGAQVSVLGTAFAVRDDAGATTIAVRHGLVQVEPVEAGDMALRLRAGDVARVAATGHTDRGKAPAEQVGAWTRGQLVVRERPVSEVVGEIRRYYDGLILLRGDSLEGRLVTGIYDLTKPQEALEAVAAVHGAAVRKYGPLLIISKNNK